MNPVPYIRKQSDLYAEFRGKLRGNAAKIRWPESEYYLGMNEALGMWAETVRVPYWYTLPDGFSSGTYEYALPNYVKPPLQIQVFRPYPYHEWGVEAASYTYVDIPGEVEPDGEGGQVLRLYVSPRQLEARVGFRAPNSVLPYPSPLPTLNEAITASSTSLVLDGVYEVMDVGHVDVGGEKLAYFGVDRGTSTTTLNNLVRGLYDTTATSHSQGDTVEWCVAVDDYALYTQLFHYTAYTLHRNFQTDGGTHERDVHQQMMLFHQQQADLFWQGYTPQKKKSRLMLGRKKFALR